MHTQHVSVLHQYQGLKGAQRVCEVGAGHLLHIESCFFAAIELSSSAFAFFWFSY